MVQTAGGDAQFFSSKRERSNWGRILMGWRKMAMTGYSIPAREPVSPGARSVLALFNTASTVWLGELTSLRTRMGELRFNGGQSGAWGRTYTNKYNIADGSGVGYQQTPEQGFTLGCGCGASARRRPMVSRGDGGSKSI